MHHHDPAWLIVPLALTTLVLLWLAIRTTRRTPPTGGNGSDSGHDAVSDLALPPRDHTLPHHLDLTCA